MYEFSQVGPNMIASSSGRAIEILGRVGLRHGEGHRRDAQVQEGQGLAAFQRPLRPEERLFQREPDGQLHLLGG